MTSDLSSEDFGIDAIFRDGGVEVALTGELDLATAPVLREHLSELVTQGKTDIAIDIAELRYIDSTGLSLLIMTQKCVKQVGGSLVVHHPNPSALKLFAITGLTEMLLGAA